MIFLQCLIMIVKTAGASTAMILKTEIHLRLASGKLLDFKESYKLCGQCHGEKYRDWKVGVHGKRTGEWNGKKEYLLCVNCHNPHSPKFQELTPEPPPVRQEDIK